VHKSAPVKFTPFTVSTNMVGASTTLEYSAKFANGDPLPSFFQIQVD